MATSFPTNQAIVVGGGLGGMSAANTVVENGGRVVLLDKSSFCGGNSTKATSGINGAGTKTQKAKGIPDNADIFTQDTLKGGAKKPELAKLLCVNSASDVDWLVEKFNLDLSLLARLGGHSQPRTHRGKERFPGMTITYALIQMLEKVAEKTDLARIVTKAKVVKLIQVLDVTSFLSEHPGGELAILTFAGKDATEEFNMIHPPDVIGKYAPDSVIGMIGGGGGGGAVAGGGGGGAVAGGIPMEEVAKHSSKTDCWVVVSGQVLDVTSFLGDHPGGELAILTFAGKDATEEFNMIHPPDVIGKYAPDAVIGVVGSGAPAGAVATGAKAGGAPARKDLGGKLANHHAWGHLDGDLQPNWRVDLEDNPGALLINVKSYFNATWFLLLSVLYEVCATIFTAKNIKISNDRLGLTRSAILLILFIVIHAVGNLHVFKGPDDFNGYGYFYVRLYWTGFGLPANIVEEYILLSVLLHVFVGLKRTWDMKLALVNTQGINVLNLAISGLMLLTFMTIHLFQFRFGDTDQFGPYYVRPPPYLINFWGILSLNLFWTQDSSIEPVGVRDIYALEFQIFKNPLWSLFYIFSVGVFMVHACLGWKKVTPVLGIPRGHIQKVEMIGYAIMIVMGLVYISFPLYVMATKPFSGYEDSIQIPGRVE
ncbi:unnamed protein product [Effrenium voratum]|uniref:Cytochrome b5 heme-binding domain-containing protein n=1 Tax=Effrenium voratum TaxID=2562239 RepID=A0AA36NCZ4_9DINO|nr:unnamed protein product [Effrenium voratum]